MNKPNSKKRNFIENYPLDDIETKLKSFQTHMSFSFEYYDNSQPAGQSFADWTQEQLSKLCDKLQNYSRESIDHWTQEAIGSGKKRGTVLALYQTFPISSEFTPPKHVPQDICWARFRLEGDMRLIGFIIPKTVAEERKINPNVFYIVFLDAHHRFYLSK